jgi:hypothetical protein
LLWQVRRLSVLDWQFIVTDRAEHHKERRRTKMQAEQLELLCMV